MINELNLLSGSDLYPFHMPGHKRQATKSGSCDWLDGAYQHDITEINGFDDLQEPKDLILSIEKRIAAYYGTDHAFLSVNGSTCGNLALISALVPGGGCLMMDEGAHRSVYNAAKIRDLKIIRLNRISLSTAGLTACISTEEVEKKLKEAENKGRLPQAVLITSPTYEGFVSDIDEIADLVHGYGIKLIADSAHGAHLNISRAVDAAVVSLHKTLPAMTQVSAILVNGDRKMAEEIKRYINIYQTTSPSYILMSSAERCMDIMETRGEELIKRHEERLNNLFSINAELKRLQITGPEYKGRYGIYDFDLSKVVVTDRTGKKSGNEIYDIFRTRYGLQPEKAEKGFCLMMTSVMDTDEGFERLKEAIQRMDYNDI